MLKNNILSDYPFIKCLHPVQIRVNGEIKLVPCGKCMACAYRKANINTMRCKMQSDSLPFTHFVTLTYRPTSLPVAYPVFDDDTGLTTIYNTTPRISDDGYFVDDIVCKDIELSKSYLELIEKKFNLGGAICYPYRRDLQLFLKSVRKYINKYYDGTKIKVYYVAEYGPRTFRVHYHLLIHHGCGKLVPSMESIVHRFWHYGRTDCQVAKDCSRYVAGYVNASSRLPQFLTHERYLKPFSRCSNFYGQNLSIINPQKIFWTPFDELDTLSYDLGGRPCTNGLPSFYVNRFFPKCRSYACFTASQLYVLYDSFRTISDYTGTTKISLNCAALTDMLCNYIRSESTAVSLLVDTLADCTAFKHFCRDDTIYSDRYIVVNSDSYKTVYTQVRNYLSCSKKFLAWCKSDYHPDYATYGNRLSFMIDFYGHEELKKLGHWYECQESFLDPNDDVTAWFDDSENLAYHTEKTALYDSFAAAITEQSEKAIKHKEVNDANKIFIYDEEYSSSINDYI